MQLATLSSEPRRDEKLFRCRAHHPLLVPPKTQKIQISKFTVLYSNQHAIRNCHVTPRIGSCILVHCNRLDLPLHPLLLWSSLLVLLLPLSFVFCCSMALQSLIYEPGQGGSGGGGGAAGASSQPTLQVLDQLLLPDEMIYVNVPNVQTTWSVIRKMQIRGTITKDCGFRVGGPQRFCSCAPD